MGDLLISFIDSRKVHNMVWVCAEQRGFIRWPIVHLQNTKTGTQDRWADVQQQLLARTPKLPLLLEKVSIRAGFGNHSQRTCLELALFVTVCYPTKVPNLMTHETGRQTKWMFKVKIIEQAYVLNFFYDFKKQDQDRKGNKNTDNPPEPQKFQER